MSAEGYPVTCACGHTYSVPGSAAGGRYTCRCGRPIDVPSLTELKNAAGIPAVSPDFLLAGLAVNGSLPPEKDCVLCGMRTLEKATYAVICERPFVQAQLPWWQWVLLGLLSPLKLIITAAVGPEGPARGNDVTLRLPVRVCEDCMQTLTTPSAVREVMLKTPDYARLFEKYPAAAIRNAD